MTDVPIDRELSVWADFNSFDANHRIIVSLRFANSPDRPMLGELVRLYDDEGNSVQGVVEEVKDLALIVRPAMETWTSAAIDIEPYPFSHAAPFSARLPDEARLTS